MSHLAFTDAQTAEWTRRRRDPKTKPRVHQRLEILRLANARWGVPRIARHLQLTESRVRHWIKRFRNEGFDGLTDRKGVGPKRRLTPDILEQIRQMTAREGRTFTAGQINDWLQEQHGFGMNERYLAQVLRKSGLSYKRTTRTLRHKQKPEQVADRKADLDTLKKGQKLD